MRAFQWYKRLAECHREEWVELDKDNCTNTKTFGIPFPWNQNNAFD
jgi:hypothetical protein